MNLIAVVVTLLAAPSPALPRYTIEDLGAIVQNDPSRIPGVPTSDAVAINASGHVAGNTDGTGYLYLDDSRYLFGDMPLGLTRDLRATSLNAVDQIIGSLFFEPFVFTGGPVELIEEKYRPEPFKLLAGRVVRIGPPGTFGNARAINDSGWVAGWYEACPDADCRFLVPRAFLYTGPAAAPPPPPPPPKDGTLAIAKDDGEGKDEPPPPPPDPYQCERAGLTDLCRALPQETMELGTLGGLLSFATDVNSQGDVVGYATNAESRNHAFLYVGGAMIDLGLNIGSVAFADNYDAVLNDVGQVAGEQADFLLGDDVPAFFYSAGRTVLLPVLPETRRRIVASALRVYAGLFQPHDINVHGEVVGHAEFPVDYADRPGTRVVSVPWLFSGCATIDLNDALPAGGPFAYLKSATGINERGQITGVGLLADGAEHGFRMTPVRCSDARGKPGSCNENREVHLPGLPPGFCPDGITPRVNPH